MIEGKSRDFIVQMDLIEALRAWADAYEEWKWLADKGDGMPKEIAAVFTAAEKGLLREWKEEMGL